MKLGYRTKPYNYENCKEAEEQAKRMGSPARREDSYSR